jgi:hypothetical protein
MDKLDLSETDSLGKHTVLCIDSAQHPFQVAMDRIKDQLRNHGLSPELLLAGRVIAPNCIAPLITDVIILGGIEYPKYPKAPAVDDQPQRLTDASLASFLRDSELARTALAAAQVKERKLVTWLWQSMGEDVKMNLRLNPVAMQAIADSDVYTLWPCIMKAATTEGVIKSVSVLNRTLKVAMLPGEAHINYADRLKHLFRLCQDLFQAPDHKGYIKLETLFSVLYLHGLEKQQYEFILNDIFTNVPDVHSLSSFETYSLKVQTYSANRHISSDSSTETTMAYSAKVTDKDVSATSFKECSVCKVSYTPLKATHTMCKNCSRKFFATQRKLSPTKSDVKAHTANVSSIPVIQSSPAISNIQQPSPSSLVPSHNRSYFTSPYESVPSHLLTDEVRALISFQAAQHRPPPSAPSSIQQQYDNLCYDEYASGTYRASNCLAWSDFLMPSAMSAPVSTLNIADNAATLHCTTDFNALINPRKLQKPIPCGGVGADTFFTHVGIDPSMPLGARDTFWGPTVQANLRSLGYLSRRGLCAYLQDIDKVLHCYYAGHLLFSAPMKTNHLYPFDSLELAPHPLVDPKCMLTDTDYWMMNANAVPPMCTGVPAAKLDAMRALHDNLIKHTSYSSSSLPPYTALAYPSQAHVHFNSEQIQRIDQVGELLKYLHYPSSGAVATGLSMGAFSLSSKLDSSDIYNHDRLVGPNPHFLAGQFTQKSMPPSDHPPAPSIGHTLSLDIRKLKEKSPQGYTHTIQVVSEYEGYFAVIPAKSATGADLFDALYHYISTTYNAHAHKVVAAHADAESVMKSMRANFGSIGISLTLSPPGQHAQRCERYIQTLDRRSRSTLDSLPYILPPAFQVYLDINVAQCMNLVPNSRSFPLTPYEKVHRHRKRFHETLPFLPFGSVCMVQMGDAKRIKNAKDMGYQLHNAVKQEVGVCMGEDPAFPQSYIFYVQSTGQVVPRRVIKVLANNVVPFDWKPKPSMFQILQQFPVDLSPSVGSNTKIQPVSSATVPSAPYIDNVLSTSESIFPLLSPIKFTPSSTAIPQHTPPSNMPVISRPNDDFLSPVIDAPIPTEQTLRTSNASVPSVPIAPQVLVPPIISPPSPPPSVSVTSLQQPLVPVNPAAQQSPPKLAKSLPPPILHSGRPQRTIKPIVKLEYDTLGGAKNYISSLQNNFIMPKIKANVPQSRPLLLPSNQRRSRSYRPCAKSFTSTTNRLVIPECDNFGLSTVVTSNTPALRSCGHLEKSSDTAISNKSPSSSFNQYPLPPPNYERSNNIYGLDTELLQKVCFLADVSSPADIPVGLRVPTCDLHEVTYNKALKDPVKYPPDQLAASVAKEMHKMFDQYAVFREITDYSTQVQPNALFIPSMALSKVKYHADGSVAGISTRLALNGTFQKPGDVGETYAATSDEASMLCLMSAFQADAIQHGYIDTLEYEKFDVRGAFLHVPLSSPRQIITRMPTNINHPMAGKLCIVDKSVYGLKGSNNAFYDDFSGEIIAAGFTRSLDPCIFYKVVPQIVGPARRCYVSTHVDDGSSMFNYRPFYTELVDRLERKYGELQKSKLNEFTGVNFTLHSNGAFTRSQEGYILRFLESVNVPGLAISKVPSVYSLFDDTSHSPPCDIKLYRSLLGSLIHTLRTRYDIQKEVVHLSSKMASPTVADLSKVVLVLRYLSGTPKLGPTYYTTLGPILTCFVDCSYGVHPDGRSHGGYSLHIGRDNAPFFVNSKRQNECVAVGSMEGEYVCLSAAARKVLEFRYFLEDVGFPQSEPTIIYEDNMSAINLAIAPAVSRKSRHIHIRHHFIRDCVQNKLVVIRHVSTDKMLADFLTKPFGPKKHALYRDTYFNINSKP